MYLHEVRDTWFETVVQAHGRGKGVLSRYADDGVMGCEREEDARRITEVLPKRFAKYGREINTAKTKVVDCGRPQRPTSGHKPGTCSFLGFVHDWGKTWRGSYTIKRKTEGKRLRRTLGEFWRWCRDNRHRPVRRSRSCSIPIADGKDSEDILGSAANLTPKGRGDKSLPTKLRTERRR